MSQSTMSQSTRLPSARSQQLAQRSRLLPGLLFLVVVYYGAAVSDRRLGAQEVTAAEAVRALEALTVDTIARTEKSVVAIARVRKDASGQRRQATVDPLSPDFVPNEFATGVVVDKGGLVLTNYHVLGDLSQNDYFVWIQRRPFTASVHRLEKVMAVDPWTDLAVLKIDATDLVPMPLGDSSQLKKGMVVIALGNPYGIARQGEVSASWGIVSNLARKATRRSLPAGGGSGAAESLHELGTLIQTDARLNLGTSGGALVNLRGQMIGLTSSLAALRGYEISAGFAIPVDATFRRVLADLKAGRRPDFGFLGVQATELSRFDRQRGRHGALVEQVLPGTPAATAGLRPGDIITRVNHQPVHDSDGLFREIGRQPALAEVALEVLREPLKEPAPRRLDLTTTLSKKYVTAVAAELVQDHPAPWRGLHVEFSTAIGVPDLSEQSQRIPLDQCVGVLSVVPQSPAWKAGLRAGDFILRVEDKIVDRPAVFQRLVDSRKGPVALELANQRTVVIQAE